MSSKKPASVMALAVISSKGRVTSLHFVQPKETVTKETYLQVLRTVIVPWMDQEAAGSPYVYESNSASAHTARIAKDYLAPLFGCLSSVVVVLGNSVTSQAHFSSHLSVDKLTSALISCATLFWSPMD